MRLFSAVLLVATLFTAGCRRSSDLPAQGTEQYRKLCSAFYLGLAALQSGEDVNARKGLKEATEIAPGEPAGWADLGLLQFRQQDYEGAFTSVQRAQALFPENSRLEALLGVIQSRRGQPGGTVAHLKKAVALDSGNLKALYSLAQETQRESTASSDGDAEQLLWKILEEQPNNLAVLVDVVRLAAKRNDKAGLGKAIAGLKASAPMWPVVAQQQFDALARDAAASNVRPAAIQAQFLRNVLVRVPAYRQSLDEVKTPVTSAGEPFLKFLRLPSPRSTPDPPDMQLQIKREQLAGVPQGNVNWIGTYVPDQNQSEQVIWADAGALHVAVGASVPLPAGRSANSRLGVHSILAADLNYDFKTDLIVASSNGLRVYQQKNPQHFIDVTGQTKLPSSILGGSYQGAWAFDVDLDGDLDLVLGTDSGEPLVLRNNGDGTFTPIHPFKAVNGLHAFASADVDGDGDPDVAMLDHDGNLKVFANERLGDYRLRDTPGAVSQSGVEVSAADVNGDGLPDFVVLKKTGQIMRLSDVNAGKAWSTGELVAPQRGTASMEHSLALADLDNNGALDLIADGQVYLSDGRVFSRLNGPAPFVLGGFLTAPTRSTLEMVGQTLERSPVAVTLNTTKQYGFQEIRPQAATTHGDQRINSFGIGGEIQVRSDLLTQLQIISSPILHFGLGSHPSAQFARIVWPNGLIQTEFALKADQMLRAEQRLKGSCPLLFAWNGSQMQYVKDIGPMSGALGAHDETGRIASVDQTEQWFKVGGDQLKAHNGALDLRITDEYWESYYIDRYGLRAIDHPVGTNVFVDERVAVPPAPLQVYVVGNLHPFARANDEQSRDVSHTINDLDGCYLATFALGKYQGIAHDHWVEVTLPANAPQRGPLYLIANGWLHPWDDGLLVAANQGTQDKLADLSLEVMNREGKWVTAKKHLGVPAGREKTVVLELTQLFEPGSQERRLRLRTNLEIYWDRLAWASAVAQNDSHDYQLSLDSALLDHRGYSQLQQNGPRTPETPVYQTTAESSGRWQPIPGYYTRYGNVLPLLQKSDDRFVIAGSGDQLRLRFAAGPPVAPGFVRDYVLAGDGWLKEGDYSFKHSTTLLPLPDHSTREYSRPVAGLEHDVVYRSHKADWRDFHTRYVAPENLASQLWK